MQAKKGSHIFFNISLLDIFKSYFATHRYYLSPKIANYTFSQKEHALHPYSKIGTGICFGGKCFKIWQNLTLFLVGQASVQEFF